MARIRVLFESARNDIRSLRGGRAEDHSRSARPAETLKVRERANPASHLHRNRDATNDPLDETTLWSLAEGGIEIDDVQHRGSLGFPGGRDFFGIRAVAGLRSLLAAQEPNAVPLP